MQNPPGHRSTIHKDSLQDNLGQNYSLIISIENPPPTGSGLLIDEEEPPAAGEPAAGESAAAKLRLRIGLGSVALEGRF